MHVNGYKETSPMDQDESSVKSGRRQSEVSGPYNAELVDRLYADWKADKSAVPEGWQMFFEGFELAMCPRNCVASDQAHAQSEIGRLIFAYRSRGHLLAKTDPLGRDPDEHPDLDLKNFGFTEADLDRVFDTGDFGPTDRMSLRDLLEQLNQTYCRSIGAEFMHIQDPVVRDWLQTRMESVRNNPAIDREKRIEILRHLFNAQLFETFIHSRYTGQKRFSLEGAETLIPVLHALVERAPKLDVEEIVIGMPHRGRLNVLANILDKSYGEIFAEFEDNWLPDSIYGSGDVKYHKGFSSDHLNRDGQSVHISLTDNPSHLEAVDPVVEGRVRAKQRQRNDREQRRKVLPLLIHGDASFAGQGIVAETLNLSQLEGYRTGGTVHVIVNNQIGFTALPEEARSSRYATDVAKMIDAPILHVNADDPEAAVYVIELALEFRQRFGKDVVVDLVCYRRHGHNEGDDPGFTQPVMYRIIKDLTPVADLYTSRLIERGDLSDLDEQVLTNEFKDRLQAAFDEVRGHARKASKESYKKLWEGLGNPYSHAPIQTGVKQERLVQIAEKLSLVPEDFSLNRKLKRKLDEIVEGVRGERALDWADAERLAFGSLLTEGIPVRLSGQDSARGTFSHRHSVWYDTRNQQRYIPLNHLSDTQERYCVYNSHLSEASVLGFELGYAMAEPRMLILWEAQFGDFTNGAQSLVDTFLTASLAKWHRSCGLVLLLPHGYEGQGPDHSSAYLERYLMACAEDNIQVCNVTTPAQYFHLLRRQMLRDFRLPLVLMAPKSLLRHPQAVSEIGAFTEGHFREVLADEPAYDKARRLVLCSGKVYYDLAEQRERLGDDSTALVRIEQFYPWPQQQLEAVLARYGKARDIVWAQEEPQNRGGWLWIRPRLESLLSGRALRYAGRPESASSAVGSLSLHKQQLDAFLKEVFQRAGEAAA
jgi:2-oxoglutarate dehydrogenase E1 component